MTRKLTINPTKYSKPSAKVSATQSKTSTSTINPSIYSKLGSRYYRFIVNILPTAAKMNARVERNQVQSKFD